MPVLSVSPFEVLDQTYLAGEYYSVSPVAINNPKVDVLTENCRSAAWLNWGRSRTLPCSPASQPLRRSQAMGSWKEGSIRERVGKEPRKVYVFCSSLFRAYANENLFGLRHFNLTVASAAFSKVFPTCLTCN